MNELDAAVRTLLSESPPPPDIEDLGGRARHRRLRHALTLVALLVVIAAATAGIAGTLGHGASSPQIAVSPTTSTTSTTSTASAAVCELGTLRRQEADLEAQEARLYNALATAVRNHSPNRDVIDARHQSVLRQLEDVMTQILGTEIDRHEKVSLAPATPVGAGACRSTTTPSTVTPAGAWCHEYQFLDAERVALKNLVESVIDQENSAIGTHSPQVGPIDAEHQAVLRRLEDIETRILSLDRHKPPNLICPQGSPPWAPALSNP